VLVVPMRVSNERGPIFPQLSTGASRRPDSFMAFFESVLAILESRVPVGVRLAVAGALTYVAFVTLVPHILTAVQTHIGLPSITTLTANALLPGGAVLILFLMHRYLPEQLFLAAQYLAAGWRKRALGIGALAVVGGSTLWAWLRPDARFVRPLPHGLMVLSLILLAAVILFQRETPGSNCSEQAEPPNNGSRFVPAWARTLSTSIVASSAVVLALLVWTIMFRLPVGAGGLREKCVQLEISTAGMPVRARRALVGAAAAKHKSPGKEMTLPTRILRKDEREAFLWMSSGQGITVPLERIGITLDYDEGIAGCVADGA
jgi:hypothetical protein